MTTEDDDPMVACEPVDDEERDDRREVPDEEDPVSEEAGYGYGV
jgi:hypothetical protein